ncbi:hypothetical protein VZT92_003361 [Zoarces viviparus]|uniref:SUN domain-containing protein n=1 Tax=Zoarces viviparus TaxID=48416 RepID=A0AAW1G1D9_ZOAVI
MTRRSSRLASCGYYNSGDESDSSSVTNISYRETPVKIFKKKSGIRKAASRTPSRASSNADSVGPDPPPAADQHDGLSPSPLRTHTQTQTQTQAQTQTQPTMRTVPYVSITATPQSPLATSSTHGQILPTLGPSVSPENSLYAGLHGSGWLALHLRPDNHTELLSQSGVESSGYSSSEGPHMKPAAATSSRNSAAPSAGYWDSISCSFCRLRAAHASVSDRMRKACGLLLLILTLLCIWLLLLFFTSLFSSLAVTKTSSHTEAESQPVLHPVTLPHPPPHPQPDTQHPAHEVVDPAVVSAASDAKMTHLLEEQLLKQEHLFSQVKERLRLEVQDAKAQLAAAAAVVDSDEWLRLQQEVSGLVERMLSYQTDSRSAAAGLRLRLQALEAQNAKLSQEWSSIQLRPPPAACPDTSSPPVQTHLTPELQQAMEKWLTDHLKGDRGSYSDCGRPMADKMADFALETQGASVISTRCSETYLFHSACVTLFGIPLWYPTESPRTVIQGHPVLLPGKCWAFHGVQGSLVISLSHPITITHVTLDHLPRCNAPTGHIDSAPRDFEVYGMKDDVEEGTLLGTFTYDEDGESTQTFRLPNPSGAVHRCVELRVLSNWGHVEYTCLYRFRVHGQMVNTR